MINKKCILILIAFLGVCELNGQTTNNSFPYLETCKDSINHKECSTIILSKYISDNLIYPEESKSKNSEGTLLLEFEINEKGLITKEKVIHSFDKFVEEEGKRFLDRMKQDLKWVPGKKGNEIVPVSFQLPISLTVLEDSVRTLKSMDELICERGSTYLYFEVEKDNLKKLFSNKRKFKNYWIYNMGKRDFFRMDITIEQSEKLKEYPQLIRISNYMCRQISKCESGDFLQIKLKEYFNGVYTETLKVIKIK